MMILALFSWENWFNLLGPNQLNRNQFNQCQLYLGCLNSSQPGSRQFNSGWINSSWLDLVQAVGFCPSLISDLDRGF